MLCSALKQTDRLRRVVMMRVIVWRICLERSVGSVTIGLAIDLRFSAALMLPAAIVIVTGRITMMTSMDSTLVAIRSKTFAGVGALA